MKCCEYLKFISFYTILLLPFWLSPVFGCAWLSPYLVVAAVLSSVCCVLFLILHFFVVVTVLLSQRSIGNNLGVGVRYAYTLPS